MNSWKSHSFGGSVVMIGDYVVETLVLIITQKIERTAAERTQASVISKGLSQVTGQERVTVLNWEPVNHTFYSVCVCVCGTHTLVCMCAQEVRVRSCRNQWFSFFHGGPRNQCQVVRLRGSTLTHWPILLASMVCT